MITDADIRHDVEHELEWAPRVDARNVHVAVRDGIVTLSGCLDSYIERLAAQDAVQWVCGVKALANEIEVALPVRTNTEIAEAALTALRLSALVPTEKLRVVVLDGCIILRGEVALRRQKQAAAAAVRAVPGARNIVNEITVKAAVALRPAVNAPAETRPHTHTHPDNPTLCVPAAGGEVTLEGEIAYPP